MKYFFQLIGLLLCIAIAPSNTLSQCESPESLWYLDIDNDDEGSVIHIAAHTTEGGICAVTAPDVSAAVLSELHISNAQYVTSSNDACPLNGTKTSEGACGCTFSFAQESDSDSDGTPDCQDACPNDSDKIIPGTCGCGTPETDSDGDTVVDCIDECPDHANGVYNSACGCAGGSTGDDDSDGIINCLDNCPNVSNNDQADSNGDQSGDACERGCTEINACNYRASATLNDGSCIFPNAAKCEQCTGWKDANGSSCLPGTEGCTNKVDALGQCQCSPVATYDVLGDCNGDCATDADGDGICDTLTGGTWQNITGEACTAGTPGCSNSDCYETATGEPCTQGDQGCLNRCDACISKLGQDELDDCNNCRGAGETYTLWHIEGGGLAPNAASAYTNTGTPCIIGETGCYNSSGQLDAGTKFYYYETSTNERCVPGTAGCAAVLSKPCTPGDTYCADLTGNCDCNNGLDNSLTMNECGECGGAVIEDTIHNCDGTCLLDVNENDICDQNEPRGCKEDATACNYDQSAAFDDPDLCLYDDVCGICGGNTSFVSVDTAGNLTTTTCTPGDTACVNAATGACDCEGNMPIPGYNCDGDIVIDVDQDGVADPQEKFGCMDESACNYDADAGYTEPLLLDPDGNTCPYTIEYQESDGSPCTCSEPGGSSCSCELIKVYATNCVSTCEVNDEIGICGGDCLLDLDNDNVCDYNTKGEYPDPCVGNYDSCNICNGSTTAFTRETTGEACTPGTYLNDLGQACNPGTVNCYACTMSVRVDQGLPTQPLYRDSANKPCIPGSTDCSDVSTYNDPQIIANACNCNGATYDAIGICGGNCIASANGIDCDLFDDSFDGTAQCFGSDSRDAVDVCGGNCDIDADNDLLCDYLIGGARGEDPCLDDNANVVDDCSVCNGNYYFKVNGIPCSPGTFVTATGDICDEPGAFGCYSCTSNLYFLGDELCEPTSYESSVDQQPCVPGSPNCVPVYPAGCNILENACNCAGDPTDASGVCGGDCAVDADKDGICDDNDGDPCSQVIGGLPCSSDPTSSLYNVDCPIIDDCNQCGGTSFFTDGSGSPCIPGSSPDCLNSSQKCDCEENTVDAIGNCGGDCDEDVDQDGSCDVRNGQQGEDLCLQLIDGSPCNSDPSSPLYNVNCPQLDECGICGGDGPLPICGCAPLLAGYCDCNLNVEDECGQCGGTGKAFGYDCDGFCINDANNNGTCDEFEPTAVTQGLVEFDGSFVLRPIQVNTAIEEFHELFRRMKTNLEEGSLTGTSKQMIIQEEINSKGTLSVAKNSLFRQNVDVAGHVVVLGNANIDTDANIMGTLYSNGGVNASHLDMEEGALNVGGRTDVGMQLDVSGVATLLGTVDITNNLTVSSNATLDSYTPGYEAPLAVAAESGNTVMNGSLNIQTGRLRIDGNSTFTEGFRALTNSRLDANATITGAYLNVSGPSTFAGDFNLNSGKFKVNSNTGDTEIAGKLYISETLTVLKNLKLTGDADILGTTFARGGLRTKKLTLFGDLSIRGHGFLFGPLLVKGNSLIKEGVGVGADFKVFANDNHTGDVWTNESGVECHYAWEDSDGATCVPAFVQTADGTTPCAAVYRNSAGAVCTPGSSGCTAQAPAGCSLQTSGSCFKVYPDDCTLDRFGEFNPSIPVMAITHTTGNTTTKGNFTVGKGLILDTTSPTTNLHLVTGNKIHVAQSLSAPQAAANVGSDLTVNGTSAFSTNLTISPNSTVRAKSLKSNGTISASNSSMNFEGNRGPNIATIDPGTTSAPITLPKFTVAATAGQVAATAWQTDIPFSATSVEGSGYIASFETDNTSGNGIMIQLGHKYPRMNNNFMSFETSDGVILGRITGSNYTEFIQSPIGITEMYAYGRAVNDATRAERQAQIVKIMAETKYYGEIAHGTAAALSLTGCFGFGAAACVPVASHIIAAAIKIAIAYGSKEAAGFIRNLTYQDLERVKDDRDDFIADVGIQSDKAYLSQEGAYGFFNTFGALPDPYLSPFTGTDSGSDFINPGGVTSTQDQAVGIVYHSGSADYAEWLPKRNNTDEFIAGQVIGVNNGQISLNTEGADHIFIISTQPAVLGNMPPEGRTENHEKVAFLGQVPVLIQGIVNLGDYVVASGKNDGLAICVSKNDISPADLSKVIGVAWDEATNPNAIHSVNVALGINDAVDNVSSELLQELSEVESEINALTEFALALKDGHEPSLLELQELELVSIPILPEEYILQPEKYKYKLRKERKSKKRQTPPEHEPTEDNSSIIDVMEFTEEAIEIGFDKARVVLQMHGVDLETHPFWSRYKKDEDLTRAAIKSVQKEINDHNDRTIREMNRYLNYDFAPMSASAFAKRKRIRKNKVSQKPKLDPKKIQGWEMSLPKDFSDIDEWLRSQEPIPQGKVNIDTERATKPNFPGTDVPSKKLNKQD